jgi:hypothetical protein
MRSFGCALTKRPLSLAPALSSTEEGSPALRPTACASGRSAGNLGGVRAGSLERTTAPTTINPPPV